MVYLVTVNGLDAGRVFELQEGWTTVGRHPDCQIVLPLDSVSRHHAVIRIRAGEAQLEDLSSCNGTRVNDCSVETLVSLVDGDVIQFGQIDFRFQHSKPSTVMKNNGTTERLAAESVSQQPAGKTTARSTEKTALYSPVATTELLRLRAQLLSRLRAFFASHDFLEVETPLVSADTTVERHLEPIPVTIHGRPLWLQTSPEFAMKRLLTTGLQALYQVTRAFRDQELGDRHNPEFSIVEWYRCGDTMDQAMDFLADLCQHVLATSLPQRLSYQEAFQEHLDLDPFAVDDRTLLKRIASLDINPPAEWRSMDRDSWLNLLLVDFVEPHLGFETPTILYDYPASQAALAKIRPGPPPVAERFELYINGIELANGYHELLDPEELLHRTERANQERQRDGNQALPVKSRLLEAMEAGLPDCCGVALGFDRLVMLAAGVDCIEEVLSFPFDRA